MLQYAYERIDNISLLVAFLGGVLSILSPCFVAVLPAFFTFTFKERKEITKMTFVFFCGMSVIFILLGLSASFVGNLLQTYRIELIVFAGISLILLGGMTIFGKGFSSFVKQRKTENDALGVFTFGMLFALGFTPCNGPILGGILFIASTLSGHLYPALLLFFYGLGLFLPLFILSIFYDSYNLRESRLIQGKTFVIGKTEIHSTQIIAGLMLIITGILFILYKGTALLNSLDPLNTREYFYSITEKIITYGIPKWLGDLFGIIIGLFITVALFLLIKYLHSKHYKKE